ncbi:MAG TPA: hypothetical protein VGO61_06950 [Steroidobacteraceae bacterium]|jgi:hypothetical protein|nr:hypothetical protein [Steroidobacteraceae bacterium]
MAISNVNTPDSNGNIRVPGRPGMLVRSWLHEGARISLYYAGSREDILALGIISPESLEPWVPGKPKGKRDLDGDPIRVNRYFSARRGEPHARFRVTLRDKLISRAETLLGGPEAIALARALAAEYREKCRRYNDSHSIEPEDTHDLAQHALHVVTLH